MTPADVPPVTPDLLGDPPEHDPGGKTFRKWSPDSVVSTRLAGVANCLRYELSEIWNAKRPLVLWLLMNPSIASIAWADPTLSRTSTFTRSWTANDGLGFGGQLIGNVHAHRVTKKRDLLKVDDPVGPENDQALLAMAARAEFVVLAYGQPPKKLRPRGAAVTAMLLAAGHDLRALCLAGDGTPCHPLYLPSDLLPVSLDRAKKRPAPKEKRIVPAPVA
jgi:hypothetical protein